MNVLLELGDGRQEGPQGASGKPDRATRQSPSRAVSALRAGIPSAVRRCKWGHALTPDNVQSVGVAGSRCRICRQRLSRESHRRRRGYYGNRPPVPFCGFCGAEMVETRTDTWECNDACPVAIGVMCEWEWDEEAKASWADYMVTERRLAQAIEARRAETAQTGSVHESAVAESDAP